MSKENIKNSDFWKHACYVLGKDSSYEDREYLDFDTADMSFGDFVKKVESNEIDLDKVEDYQIIRYLEDEELYKEFGFNLVSDENEYEEGGAAYTKVIEWKGEYYKYQYSYYSNYGNDFDDAEFKRVHKKQVMVDIFE